MARSQKTNMKRISANLGRATADALNKGDHGNAIKPGHDYEKEWKDEMSKEGAE